MSTPIFSLFSAALASFSDVQSRKRRGERAFKRIEWKDSSCTYVCCSYNWRVLSSLLFHYSSLFLWQKTTLPKVHPYSGEHLKTLPSYLTSYYMQPTTFIHFLMQSLCSNCAIEVFTPVVTSNMSRVLFLFRLFSRERERMRLWCWHELP